MTDPAAAARAAHEEQLSRRIHDRMAGVRDGIEGWVLPPVQDAFALGLTVLALSVAAIVGTAIAVMIAGPDRLPAGAGALRGVWSAFCWSALAALAYHACSSSLQSHRPILFRHYRRTLERALRERGFDADARVDEVETQVMRVMRITRILQIVIGIVMYGAFFGALARLLDFAATLLPR